MKIKEAYEKHLELFGSEACEYHTFWNRFKKHGELAIATPKETKTIGSLPRKIQQAGSDMSPVTVNSRMKTGMTFEVAVSLPIKRKPKLQTQIEKAIKFLETQGYTITK